MANAASTQGREPFDVRAWVRAAGEGDAAGVESLLAAGADVNASLESGETALIRATSKGRLEVVRRLLEAGADPNAEREDGFTALGVAVFFGYTDIVRALLAGGADPTAKGRLGETVEKWALVSGYGEITELLRGHGSSGAQSSGAGAAKSGAPAFFPTEGTFSPVVPLAELAEPPAWGSSAAEGRGDGGGAEQETKDYEVITVVRPRVRPAPAAPPVRAVRPKIPRQPWSLTLLLLGLSVIAGLVAGTYLLGTRRSAETSRPATPPVEEAAAADTAPAPQAAPNAADTQPPATDAQPIAAASAPEPEPPAAPPEKAAKAAAAPVAADADADSKPEKTNGAKPSARAPQPAAAESRRAPKAEPASRGESPAAAKAVRASTPAPRERAGGARRVASPANRSAQRTGARPVTATPRAAPPPVFSPPANKSERRKVIPWP